MKKIIAVILVVVMLTTLLAGCGNMSLGFGNYSYETVHVDTHNYSGCLSVEKWYENGGSGIEVLTKEGVSLFLSEGTYTLIGGDNGCPLCER